MNVKYTLEQIKELVRLQRVNMTNFYEIIEALKAYSGSEVTQILREMSYNTNLPEDIREELRDAKVAGDVDVVPDPEPFLEPVVPDVFEPNPFEPTEPPLESEELIEPDVVAPVKGIYSSANDGDDTISLESDEVLGALVTTATAKGINVIASNPGLDGKPEISFELTPEAKPYIDNLLLSMHENEEDINIELTRLPDGKEVFTAKIDKPYLPDAHIQDDSKRLFNQVNNVINNTDKERDYEAEMPIKLRELKDKFHGDDPHIPDKDFKIGYSRKGGENTYYIIADSKMEAIELAEEMGYEVGKDHGGNAFEINTQGKEMEGSKLDVASENVNEIDELKTTDNGLSDLDINYNNKHYENDNYQVIAEFLENSKDPSTMAVVQIDAHGDQRVVSLASEDGVRRTIVINDGKEFDSYTLPKIAEAYGKGSTISENNVTKTEYGNGVAGYDVLSSDNTYLRLNNYDSNVVNTVDGLLDSFKTQENIESYDNSNAKNNNKVYTKSLGAYPTNNTEAAKASFMTLFIFAMVMFIGFAILYLMYGG